MKAVIALVLFAAVAVAGVSVNSARAGERCTAINGACKDGACNGVQTKGLCPGSSVCCVPWANSAACAAKNGVCANKVGCAGTQVTGLCPGASVCCTSGAAPVTPPPVTPPPVTPPPVTPPPVTPVVPGADVGVVKRIPTGSGQIGFCSADGKKVGLCKSSAACGRLASHTAKAGVCTHSQVCCIPPDGVALDGQLGIDVEGAVISQKTAQCYKESGLSYFMVRVWRTSNVVDATCAPNLRMLKSVGITDLDVYMFHDYRKDPVAAVNSFMKYLKDENVLSIVKRVWLDIERDINGVYMWSRTDKAGNLKKLLNAIEATKKWGKLPGIYAPGAGGWDEIMGSGKVNDNVPMWYVSKRGYNNDASHEDWVPFANWQTKSNLQHQFYSGDNSNFKVCGVSGLDWTYRAAPITLPYNWDPVRNVAI